MLCVSRDLAVGVLHDVALGAVQHAHARPLGVGKAGGVFAAFDASPARLDADQPHALVVEEGVEDAHGVAAAADAGDDGVGQPPGAVQRVLHLARASRPMTLWKSRTMAG
jgi:hypothetical protein